MVLLDFLLSKVTTTAMMMTTMMIRTVNSPKAKRLEASKKKKHPIFPTIP